MLTLHIGLPKTGTTFLQYRVFKSGEDELQYIHDPRDKSDDAIERLLKRYFRKESGSLESLERSIAQGLPRGDVLVSNENISMLPPEAWKAGGPPPSRFSARLRRLGKAVGGIRVILGIRRQDQWLGSRYAESAKNFDEFGQAEFESRMKDLCRSPLSGSLEWLQYAGAYERLADGVGRENVLVLPSEELLGNPEPTLERLEAFLGHRGFVDAYRAAKSPSAVRRNVLSTGRNSWELRGREDGGTVTLPDDLESLLLDRFREENRALDRTLGGQLKAHGYH